jgi:hypothetical protein
MPELLQAEDDPGDVYLIREDSVLDRFGAETRSGPRKGNCQSRGRDPA